MATPVPFDGLADLEQFLNRADISTDAHKLELHLEAATEAVEGWQSIGPLVTRAFVERATASCGRLILGKTPVVSVTSAKRMPDGAVLDGSGWDVDKIAGIATGNIPSGTYDVTFQAGRGVVAEVPTSLRVAVLMIAEHMWEIQRGPRSRNFVGHASSDESSMHRVSSGYLIPNRAAHLMQPYAQVLVG